MKLLKLKPKRIPETLGYLNSTVWKGHVGQYTGSIIIVNRLRMDIDINNPIYNLVVSIIIPKIRKDFYK